jgi:hypothetical protein
MITHVHIGYASMDSITPPSLAKSDASKDGLLCHATPPATPRHDDPPTCRKLRIGKAGMLPYVGGWLSWFGLWRLQQ